MNIQETVRSAEQCFAAGRHAQAVPLLDAALAVLPDHPALLQLAGLNCKALDRLDQACALLRQAHRLAPGDAQIASNLGNALNAAGETDDALAAYDAAIRTDPAFIQAHTNKAAALSAASRDGDARTILHVALGIAPRDVNALVALGAVESRLGDARAARRAFDRALVVSPAHPAALSGRARVALDCGEAAAVHYHERALDRQPDDCALRLDWMRARMFEGGDDPSDLLERWIAADPDWIEAAELLSLFRWERGRRHDYMAALDAAVMRAPRDIVAWRTYTNMVAGTASYGAAADGFAHAYRATGAVEFLVREASYRSSSGELDTADRLFATLPQDRVVIPLARHLLRRGDAQRARDLLEPRVAEPGPPDILAWATLGLAWQLLADDRLAWLHRQPGLVATIALGLSERDQADATARLRELHSDRADPVSQSVRGGTQTRGDLLHRIEPEIATIREAFHDALDTYRAGLPPADPRHPLLRFRDSPWMISGSWSVRLSGGGHHASHIHQRGMISSASYWLLPPVSLEDEQAGWLMLGGAPEDFELPVKPFGKIEPFGTIKPEVGALVLFPSTLHHGTRAFPHGERMTVAFDVSPRD